MRLRAEIEHQQRARAGREMVECTFQPAVRRHAKQRSLAPGCS